MEEYYSYIVVIIVTKSQEEAEKIGKVMVEEKLAASANIIPKIKSLFFWKEKFYHINESILLLNTRKDLFGKVKDRTRELHSYELPEIIAIPIISGSSDFLNWIKENTR